MKTLNTKIIPVLITLMKALRKNGFPCRYKEQINSHVNYYLSVEKDEEIEDSNQFEKMDIADQLTPAAVDRPIQNSRRDILAKIENDNPILGMRARAIVECFFKSVCDPVIQVSST